MPELREVVKELLNALKAFQRSSPSAEARTPLENAERLLTELDPKPPEAAAETPEPPAEAEPTEESHEAGRGRRGRDRS